MTHSVDDRSPDHSLTALESHARRIRMRLVRMSHDSGAAHLGSSMSCVDVLVALYWKSLGVDPNKPGDPNRDRLILSKGHASAALYATLAERGFFDEELLETFGQPGGHLPEQMSPGCVPGVEAATGSLGHGLSLGVGMALASKITRQPYRVWAVLSDGECNEGAVWEAAMFAAAQKLDNLVAVIDYNGWQATGRSNEIMALEPLADKWRSFGWMTREINGHDLSELSETVRQIPFAADKPTCIVTRTIKGKGVSFMEDDNNWHYRIPNDDELKAALTELQDV